MPTLHGAVLCDAAKEYTGKVSILGGFVSVVGSAAFPFVCPISFAGRVGFHLDELDRPHTIFVRMERDEDGELLAELRGDVPAGRPAQVEHPDLAIGVNLVHPLPVGIDRPGLYWVTLRVDEDVDLVRLPLKVVVAGQP